MRTKPKICFVVSTLLTVKAFLRDHIKSLSQEYDIHIVANIKNGEIQELQDLNIKEFKHIPIYRDINIIQDMKSVILLRKYFCENKFDTIHSITPKAGLLTSLAGKFSPVKVRIHIFTGQVWHTQKGIKKWILMLLDRIISTLNTHILVDSEPQRQFLIKKGIVKLNSSYVLGKGSISGVNIDRFIPCYFTKEKKRKELCFYTNCIVFVYLGRLNKDKGILDLFEAFNMLVIDTTNVHLMLVGMDEEKMILEVPKYKNIKPGDNFTFYGPTSNPEEVLQAADVFCLPSYREGFGTSVIEAACLELPCICSDTYGLLDTIIDGQTGLRHRVGNTHDLYKQMKTLALSSELRKKMGKNGRKYVLQNFTSSNITSYWLEFYKNL